MTRTSLPRLQNPCPPKRIVVITTEGPHTGMHRILGLTSQFDDYSELGRPYPPFLPSVIHVDGHDAGASLIRVTPRMAVYQELILPTSVKLREGTHGPKPFDSQQQ